MDMPYVEREAGTDYSRNHRSRSYLILEAAYLCTYSFIIHSSSPRVLTEPFALVMVIVQEEGKMNNS